LKNKSDSLNVVLTNNLTRSLSREELKDVDVKVLKGVVYISLSDNMLYKSGDYNISERAGETLSKIAKIIKDYGAYDIWGDSVNTAARMEQNSEHFKINISQSTYDIVKDNFQCTYRGELEAKNKGKLKMYFAESKQA
jgi:hypothetical protein